MTGGATRTEWTGVRYAQGVTMHRIYQPNTKSTGEPAPLIPWWIVAKTQGVVCRRDIQEVSQSWEHTGWCALTIPRARDNDWRVIIAAGKIRHDGVGSSVSEITGRDVHHTPVLKSHLRRVTCSLWNGSWRRQKSSNVGGTGDDGHITFGRTTEHDMRGVKLRGDFRLATTRQTDAERGWWSKRKKTNHDQIFGLLCCHVTSCLKIFLSSFVSPFVDSVHPLVPDDEAR